jgi:signal transduction histidine kinase
VAHRNRELAGRWEHSQSMVEEAIQSKSELMNMAAHELRTPVAVIGGYASMLQDEDFGPLSDAIRKPVNVIAGKARELAGLVDDILMAARLEEEEALAVRVKRLDLRTLVQVAVERAQPRVAMVEARLTYELPAQPVMVDADPDHVGRILDNLLNNALSYSERTPIVKLGVTGDPEPQVRVTDNGWGIAAADWKRIFERFVRLDEPARMHVPGTGLGLAIARDLAERYGGEVILEDSEPGRGSTFGLRFPAAGSFPRVVKADVPPIRRIASRTRHAQGG